MSAPASGLSSGQWSLWDMINFMLPHYQACLSIVSQEIAVAASKAVADADAVLDDADKDRIRQNFQYLMTKAEEYGLATVQDRIKRIYDTLRLNASVPTGEVIRQMRAMMEAFEDDTKFLYLYAYPKDKIQRWIKRHAEWEVAFAAIPAIIDDVDRATDLYALGQNMACVFHLMRVMETGVHRFGKKLGIPLSVLSTAKLKDLGWHEILNAINPKLKALPLDTASRKAKHEKLSAVQSYLYGVKDAWRNPTMHPRRKGYNDQETLDILNHVRMFMNELASVVSRR